MWRASENALDKALVGIPGAGIVRISETAGLGSLLESTINDAPKSDSFRRFAIPHHFQTGMLRLVL